MTHSAGVERRPIGLGGEGAAAGAVGPRIRFPSSAAKRIIVGYGFWIFLLSDIIMFSAFFATYAVLVERDGRRPERPGSVSISTIVAIETACLLLSSFTCGMATIGARARRDTHVLRRHGGDRLLRRGLPVPGDPRIRRHDRQGAGPQRSAFLSAFFTLVGCHGVHVTLGLLWLLTMMAQVFAKGYRADILRRVLCFALFWHTLDIIWVAIFTVVYLLGVVL